MRDFGQQYIKIYKPNKNQIKFIKDVSKCKTPALGGQVVICNGCGHKTYRYHSCGNSQCPKCQSIKRLQWQDKLASKMLNCPYQHIVFTIPHQLNFITKKYDSILYKTLFTASWKTLAKACKDPTNLGATPGMVAVLHTFGSDLKHHVHLHTLVTFGGLDKHNKWQWPKRSKKLASYRQLSRIFREVFLAELKKVLSLQDKDYYDSLHDVIRQVSNIRWCVHNTPPTAHTKVIQEYLGRYICRIGISHSRLKYDSQSKEIQLQYNDYKNQQNGQPAPKALKILHPLVAINLMMQHVLPSYFQKVRYYGLMNGSKLKSIQKISPQLIKENKITVRTLIQIVKSLLKLNDDEDINCPLCAATDFTLEPIKPNTSWYDKNIRPKQEVNIRSPDQNPKLSSSTTNVCYAMLSEAMHKTLSFDSNKPIKTL